MAKKKAQVRITLTLPDGSRKYFSGSTRKEAEEKRDEAKILLAKGYDISSRITFRELYNVWMKKYKARRNLHARTIETAEGIFDRYLLPAFGDMPITDIKPAHIDNLLIATANLSQSTQKKCLEYTRSVFDLAIENELVPRSPTHKKKPTAEKSEKVRALTDAQCEALLEAVKGTRAYLFVYILLNCGLRKGEALGLMWSDIDFDKMMLRVDRSLVHSNKDQIGTISNLMKTDASHRTIPLSGEAVELLRSEKEKSDSRYIFSMKDGKPLTYPSFRRLWDLIAYRTIGGPNVSDRVQQTLDFTVHPHQLRHTCCTRWLANGFTPKEVQYLMGHATSSVTMDIYADYLAQQELEKTAEKIRARNV